MLARVQRWYHTLAPLTASQLGWRVYYLLESRWPPPRRMPGAPATHPLPPHLFASHDRAGPADGIVCRGLKDGEITFLQCRRRIRASGGTWQWESGPGTPAASRLWLFQLHSFGFAPALAREGCLPLLHALVESWTRMYPWPVARARRLAWNSYTISNRLDHCAYAHAVSVQPWPAPIRQALRRQAAFLHAHLELDLRGNHLIRNASALLAASCWMDVPEARAWRRRALSVLQACLRSQILPDGCHYELSPMYHLLVMEDFVQSLRLLRYVGDAPGVQAELCGALERMRPWAAALDWHRGEIPLLGDASPGVALPPARLLGELDGLLGPAQGPPGAWFPSAGYARLENACWRVLLDGGRLGPDEQPGHAHCDLGALIAASQDETVLEDTGVFEYEAGTRRRYARSTAAHSTLQVGESEQGDCWAEFRLGRRAQPLVFAMTGASSCRLEYQWPNPKVRHAREVTLAANELRVHDCITGAASCPLTLRWHLAPGWVPEPGALGRWRSATGRCLEVELSAGWNWSIQSRPFYPGFGREQARWCLEGRRREPLPARAETIFRIPLHA